MNHTYSIETLVHYQCGNCSSRWTVSESHQLLPIDYRKCPMCGWLMSMKKKGDE